MMLSNTIKLQTGVTLAAVTAARQTSGSRGARAAWPGIAEFWRPPELVRLAEPSSYVHGVSCTSVNIPTGTRCWAGSSPCHCFSRWWVGPTAPLIPAPSFQELLLPSPHKLRELSRCCLLPATPGTRGRQIHFKCVSTALKMNVFKTGAPSKYGISYQVLLIVQSQGKVSVRGFRHFQQIRNWVNLLF